jgi:hypothetical protein
VVLIILRAPRIDAVAVKTAVGVGEDRERNTSLTATGLILPPSQKVDWASGAGSVTAAKRHRKIAWSRLAPGSKRPPKILRRSREAAQRFSARSRMVTGVLSALHPRFTLPFLGLIAPGFIPEPLRGRTVVASGFSATFESGKLFYSRSLRTNLTLARPELRVVGRRLIMPDTCRPPV